MFFVIIGVDTPPRVSIPKVNGKTSKSKTLLMSPSGVLPSSFAVNISASIAAPIATTSSGLIDLLGSFPK